MRLLLLALLALSLSAADTPQWRTAFVKRGFVGTFQNAWLKGPESVIRTRTPLPFAGTAVKVQMVGAHKADITLANLALIHGSDDDGAADGPAYPILFAGQPGCNFSGANERWSDETQIPLQPGTWYVQDVYNSPIMPYAYDVDSTHSAPKGSTQNADFTGANNGSRAGCLRTIEVLTTDTRSGIVCYGDSITHGYNSTPNRGKRYPDVLATLLNRPVLNLGVNGDVINQTGGTPQIISQLKGVDDVVFLMGINDLIGGGITSVDAYSTKLSNVISGLKAQHKKIYVGTILPAAGYKKYDEKGPAIETLRQAINAYIRTTSGATAIIDFDTALADPAHPTQLKTDFQSDHLHPSDAGYQAMAEAAAKVLKK